MGNTHAAAVPTAINQRWSLDFVADALSGGQRFRILNVADDFSREGLAATVDTSLSGVRVVRELERLSTERAMPQVWSAIIGPNWLAMPYYAGLVAGWAGSRLGW